MDARDAWAVLEPEWRRCLGLAWKSYLEGSIGVGAVLTAPDGEVVSEGRSRWHEEHRTTPDLSGGKLAHAETEALARMSNDNRLGGHTIWTSLEPCLMCAGAILVAGVRTVRYLGADHLWLGIERLPELNPFIAERWPVRYGPRPDQFGILGSLLPLAAVAREFRSRSGESRALAAQREADPRVADLAEAVVDELEQAEPARVEDVAGLLWQRLTELSGRSADP